jgi:holo-[acyl-carrier protein] synthase
VIVGLGTDLVEVERFRQALTRRATFAERLFTDAERAYGDEQFDPAESLAARFAAKEAVMKALGAGIGDFEFRDVEIVRAESGEPSVMLTGKARDRAAARGVVGWHVSLSHAGGMAMAVAIAVGS